MKNKKSCMKIIIKDLKVNWFLQASQALQSLTSNQ